MKKSKFITTNNCLHREIFYSAFKFEFDSEVSEKSVLEHRDQLYSRIGTQLILTIGSNIILRSNLWKEAGLFNGAKGIIVDIIYHQNAKLNDIPVCVLIKFDKFLGRDRL